MIYLFFLFLSLFPGIGTSMEGRMILYLIIAMLLVFLIPPAIIALVLVPLVIKASANLIKAFDLSGAGFPLLLLLGTVILSIALNAPYNVVIGLGLALYAIYAGIMYTLSGDAAPLNNLIAYFIMGLVLLKFGSFSIAALGVSATLYFLFEALGPLIWLIWTPGSLFGALLLFLPLLVIASVLGIYFSS